VKFLFIKFSPFLISPYPLQIHSEHTDFTNSEQMSHFNEHGKVQQGFTDFSKNLEATSKFPKLEEWQEASSTVRTHNSEVICEPHHHQSLPAQCMTLIHILVCKDAKTAKVMVKMLGTTVQNLVAWATRCLRFVHPWSIVTCSASSNKHNINSSHSSPKWWIMHTVKDTHFSRLECNISHL
jgi:hypothetical protein